MLSYCFIFFFSSRRRHTRWPRDWSSDVCSSDLVPGSGDVDVDPGQAGAAPPEIAQVGERGLGGRLQDLPGERPLERQSRHSLADVIDRDVQPAGVEAKPAEL